jgi:hypothetical protein
MNKPIFAALIAAICSTPLAAEEIDLAAGEELLNANCYRGCHGANDTEVYTREDRRVTSMEKLNAQVRRCEQMLGLQWFEEDIFNTAGYLNQAFYKFK